MTAVATPIPRSAARLNEKVQGLAKALGCSAGSRDTFIGNGTTLRWPLFGQDGRGYTVELWVGYARLRSNVEGQMAMAALIGADGNALRQVCLLSPDTETVNRNQALKTARQRMADWLISVTEKAAAGEPLSARRRSNAQT